MRDVCLLHRESHLQLLAQQLADLGSQRFGVGPFAVHEHDEVVSETHQPIVRQPFAAALLTPPRRAHVPFLDQHEMPIQNRQVDVGQQRRGDSTLRRAGQARRETPVFADDPGPQERTDQAQHLAIGDTLSHQAHQDLVIDVVETRGDVPFDHPFIALGVHLVDLGDGILRPSPRPIPVGMRVELGLEDRFQNQLERHLRHPIPQGRYPEMTDFAALLRDRHPPDRQRGERAFSQGISQFLQKGQHPDDVLDVTAGDRIHPCRPGAPVARHTIPGDQQSRPITDQIEHIIEPLTRFVFRPSVQLALVTEYPTFGHEQHRLVQRTAIQR